LNLPGKLSN